MRGVWGGGDPLIVHVRVGDGSRRSLFRRRIIGSFHPGPLVSEYLEVAGAEMRVERNKCTHKSVLFEIITPPEGFCDFRKFFFLSTRKNMWLQTVHCFFILFNAFIVETTGCAGNTFLFSSATERCV